MHFDLRASQWKIITIALCVAIATGFTACNPAKHSKENALKADEVKRQMGDFQGTVGGEIADQIAKSAGVSSKSFTVFPTDNLAIWDIGSIVDSGRTTDNLVDTAACKVAAPSPVPFNALNGSYSYTNDATFNAGLDKAIGAVASAGANFHRGSTIKLSLDSSQLQLLSKDQLKKLLSNPDCGGHQYDGPQFLVRGYILAKRDYEISSTTKIGAKADIKSAANFDVSWQPGDTTISVVDKQPMQLVMILSVLEPQVLLQPSGGRPSGSSPLPPSESAPPSVNLSAINSQVYAKAKRYPGRIYLQIDEADDLEAGYKLIYELGESKYLLEHHVPIEHVIDRLPSRKMPIAVTVKYFDKANHQTADAVYETVRKIYPDTKFVYVPLPLPPSSDQVEVWLARKR